MAQDFPPTVNGDLDAAQRVYAYRLGQARRVQHVGDVNWFARWNLHAAQFILAAIDPRLTGHSGFLKIVYLHIVYLAHERSVGVHPVADRKTIRHGRRRDGANLVTIHNDNHRFFRYQNQAQMIPGREPLTFQQDAQAPLLLEGHHIPRLSHDAGHPSPFGKQVDNQVGMLPFQVLDGEISLYLGNRPVDPGREVTVARFLVWVFGHDDQGTPVVYLRHVAISRWTPFPAHLVQGTPVKVVVEFQFSALRGQRRPSNAQVVHKDHTVFDDDQAHRASQNLDLGIEHQVAIQEGGQTIPHDDHSQVMPYPFVVRFEIVNVSSTWLLKELPTILGKDEYYPPSLALPVGQRTRT